MTAALDYKTQLVSQLISSCYKAQNGYRSAASAVEDDTLKRLFQIYAQQRTRFAEELREYLPPDSVDVDAERAEQIFADARYVSGDESIRECLEIDSKTVDLYKRALAHRALPTRAHFLISSQLALLERVHDRMNMMLHGGAPRPHQAYRLSA